MSDFGMTDIRVPDGLNFFSGHYPSGFPRLVFGRFIFAYPTPAKIC
jgi:hypothetical protein